MDLSFKFASENEVPGGADPGCGVMGVGFERIVWVAGMSRGAGKSDRALENGDPEVEELGKSPDEAGGIELDDVDVGEWDAPFTARMLFTPPTSLSGGDTAIVGAPDSSKESPLVASSSSLGGIEVRSDTMDAFDRLP